MQLWSRVERRAPRVARYCVAISRRQYILHGHGARELRELSKGSKNVNGVIKGVIDRRERINWDIVWRRRKELEYFFGKVTGYEDTKKKKRKKL